MNRFEVLKAIFKLNELDGTKLTSLDAGWSIYNGLVVAEVSAELTDTMLFRDFAAVSDKAARLY